MTRPLVSVVIAIFALSFLLEGCSPAPGSNVPPEKVVDGETDEEGAETPDGAPDDPPQEPDDLAKVPPSAAFTFTGDARAHKRGDWSEVLDWPFMPIHMMLLPEGKVLSYGTGASGSGPAFIYGVWDPADASQMVLDVTTETDIFCTAQAVIPGTSQVLLAGGTTELDGNSEDGSSADINFFSLDDYSLEKSPRQMLAGRFYPTITTLANGEMLVHGGRSEPGEPVLTPEVYTPGLGWRELRGATSEDAYRIWYYPWSFLAPDGRVFFTGDHYGMWFLDTEGEGELEFAGERPDGVWRASGSAVMFEDTKILITGGQSKGVSHDSAVILDIAEGEVAFGEAAPMRYARSEHDLTLLPDGTVLASGGSAIRNELEGVAYEPEIWDPKTDTWTTMKAEAKPRLYHSATLLLPDGRVLSGGGGRPGPVTNLDAELFYPPYLFKQDGSGELAKRPKITALEQAEYGEAFRVKVEGEVSRVTLLRGGSVTHAWNMEQRFYELDFSREGDTLRVSAPEQPEVAPPGYYMLFVLDEAGVPSHGQSVMLNLTD